MSEESEFDTSCTDNVICPYCGHDNGGDDGDGPPSGHIQCYNEDCEKMFECEPSFSVSYYTSKMDCLNGSPHEWGKTFFYKEDEKGLRSCKFCHKNEWVQKDASAG